MADFTRVSFISDRLGKMGYVVSKKDGPRGGRRDLVRRVFALSMEYTRKRHKKNTENRAMINRAKSEESEPHDLSPGQALMSLSELMEHENKSE